MENDIFSVFSRLLGFQYTTSTSVFIFFALCFVVGGALLWGLHRFNEYTIDFYLSEIMPATPLERWWSGFIFGSRVFLISSMNMSLFLLSLIGVIQISLSCIFFILDWILTAKLSNSGFFIINLALGMIVAFMGRRLYQSSPSVMNIERLNEEFHFQVNKFIVSITWLISGLLVVYFFSGFVKSNNVTLMVAITQLFLIMTIGMIQIYSKTQKSENRSKSDRILTSGSLQTDTSDQDLNEILRNIELENKPVIKYKNIPRPADMPWRLSNMEDPPSEEEKKG
jgi:hypothetical protein